MPEIVDGKKIFTLGEFAASIQRAFGKFYSANYWLKAEISKLNFFPRSGHCYPELSESSNGNLTAAFTGFIHKDIYKKLNAKFIDTVGEPLHDGMKVTVQCTAHYSCTRGIRLTINDIDIDSILGEQARRRQDTIEQLKSEGIFAQNKTVPLPRIIKNIAIISVETGKGYADFMSIIQSACGIRLNTTLYPALMMGPEAASQIKSALEKIQPHAVQYDAVCIIRGGGGENTLQCFNDIELCRAIALSPLPVLTGIGHATNETIAEETARMSFVSPSELANFFIDKYAAEISGFHSLANKISQLLANRLYSRQQQFDTPIKNMRYKYNVVFRRKSQDIANAITTNNLKIRAAFHSKRNAISAKATHIAFTINSLHQQHLQLLEAASSKIHGASVRVISFKSNNIQQLQMAAEPVSDIRVMVGGRMLGSISELNKGDVIRIVLPEGVITAEVKTIDPKMKI